MQLQQRLFLVHFVSKQESQSLEKKTVSRRINKEKIVARIPFRKPLFSKKIQKVHLDFATEHILLPERQWNTILFSDESKFLFGSDGKWFVRRKNGESLYPQCIMKTEIWSGKRNDVGDDFFSDSRTHCSFSR